MVNTGCAQHETERRSSKHTVSGRVENNYHSATAASLWCVCADITIVSKCPVGLGSTVWSACARTHAVVAGAGRNGQQRAVRHSPRDGHQPRAVRHSLLHTRLNNNNHSSPITATVKMVFSALFDNCCPLTPDEDAYGLQLMHDLRSLPSLNAFVFHHLRQLLLPIGSASAVILSGVSPVQVMESLR